MTRKLDVVNFLRGYSITTIVLMHLVQGYGLPGWAFKATSFGGAGVHVFILCSGFGLYLSYLNKPLGYKDFLRKRFGRIYWPMAIVCVATAFWMLYQGKAILMPLLGNLLLFKMFVPELESSMGGQMWFISTIIQFYLAWPLIVKLINIKRRGVLDYPCRQSAVGDVCLFVRPQRRTGVEQLFPAIPVGVLSGHEVGRILYEEARGFGFTQMEISCASLCCRHGAYRSDGLDGIPVEIV